MAPYSPIQKALGGKSYDYSPGIPAATGGKTQPISGSKKVKVKAHTRQVSTGPGRRAYLGNDPEHLRQFQKFHGLAVTGKWDPATQQYAHSHNTRLVASGRFEDLAHAGGAPSPAQAPQTGLDATTKNLIDAAVRLKFGGQDQALQQQLNQNARFTSGVPAWYQQARDAITAQQQQVPQATMPAPTGDPATDSRNAAAYAYQQQRNNAIGAGNQFLTNVGAGLQAAQDNTINSANAQRQGLLGQKTQLAGQKGDFRTTTLADMQAQQAKAAIDQQKLDVAMQALGIKATDPSRKIDQAKLDFFTKHGYWPETGAPKGPSATEQINRAKLDYFNKHGYWPPTGPPKPKKGSSGDGGNFRYSKSKIQGFQEKWDYAKATAVQLYHRGSYTDKRTKKTQPISVDVAYGALLGQIHDPDIAKAAAYKAFGKQLPPDLVHRLAIKGVHPGSIKIKPSVGGGPYGTGSMP